MRGTQACSSPFLPDRRLQCDLEASSDRLCGQERLYFTKLLGFHTEGEGGWGPASPGVCPESYVVCPRPLGVEHQIPAPGPLLLVPVARAWYIVVWGVLYILQEPCTRVPAAVAEARNACQ